MGKAPAFQFYPNDWSRDLEEHPLEIEGAWIRICCKLWWSETRGQASFSLTKWARVMRVGEKKSKTILDYLLNQKIADGVNQNGTYTISSRRMLRDEYIRNIRKIAGQKGGNPALIKSPILDNQNLVNQKPTPSSSSSSSSSKNKEKKNIVAFSDSFIEFWKEYPERNGKKVGKSEAFKEWQIIKPDELLIKQIHSALKEQKQNFKYLKETGDFVAEFPDACRWLKRKRWTDEVKDLTQLQHEKVRESW